MDATGDKKVESEEVVYRTKDQDYRPKLLIAERDGGKKDCWFLYISVFTVNLMPFISGTSVSWTSPVLPRLKNSDPNINPLGEPITPLHESLIVGLLCLGAALGPLFTGKLADSVGRKKSLLILALPMMVSYIAMIFFVNIQVFCVTRFIIGVCLGGSFAIGPMYVGEITQDHNRGKFGCFLVIFMSFGLIYLFAIGPFLSVRALNIACLVPLVLFITFFGLFIPETPVYLVSVGKKNEAEKTLRKLRHKDNNIKEELQQIIKSFDVTAGENETIINIFKKRNLRKGFIITAGLLVLQQFAGISIVLAYLEPILDATGTSMSTYLSSIFVTLIQLFSNVFAALQVEKLGRKLLLLVSMVGSSVSLIVFGLYFYLKNSNIYDVKNIFWLPMACLVIYMITYNLGIGPLPWVILGEVFPANARTLASSMSSFCAFITAFVIFLCFPLVAGHLGMAYCFWIFGVCCIFGVVFVYCLVPETKGKSSEEIQAILNKNN